MTAPAVATAPQQAQAQALAQGSATGAVALPAALAGLAALILALDQARVHAESTAARMATAAVQDFNGWYRTPAITDWSAALSGDIQIVLKAFAGTVDAYMATIVSEVAGRHMRPAGTIDVASMRQGITPAGVYGRTADAYRFQQSKADQAAKSLLTNSSPSVPNLVAPADAALQRALSSVHRDVGLVVQQQANKTLQQAGKQGLITAWRRVIHPELSRTGTCGLCIAASTRLYKTGELMALHDNCHCQPVPVILGQADPGLQLDQHAFTQLYGAAGGNTAAALKKTRYMVVHNGELGPVLAPAGSKQRTPRQVATDTAPIPSRPQPVSAQLRKLQELHDSLQRTLPRLDELVAADPAEWTPYRDSIVERIDDLQKQLTAA